MIKIIENPEIPCFSELQNVGESIEIKRSSLGFIDVDTSVNTKEITEYISQIHESFDTMVVLWIGGSALGTRAIFEALKWKHHNEKLWVKKLYILDSIETDSISDLLEALDLKSTIFCVISKSGSTIETQSQYVFFRKKIQEITGEWKKHFCFVVWEKFSHKDTLQKDFKVFELAENIWGRFSVFTPVGLLPLAFAWIRIDAILQGISEIKDSCLNANTSENIALKLAFLQQYFYEKEWKNICVLFPYSTRLGQVGEWYKQLMAESIWKDGIWITPCSAIGVTDQHSQLQLYQDGPQDKLFITLEVVNSNTELFIDARETLSFDRLMKIEKFWTESSLRNEWIPLVSLSMEKLDEKNIAQLLYIFEFQIAYLGELFFIDAFNQPGVEKSKIITKQKLKEDFPDVDMSREAFSL